MSDARPSGDAADAMPPYCETAESKPSIRCDDFTNLAGRIADAEAGAVYGTFTGSFANADASVLLGPHGYVGGGFKARATWRSREDQPGVLLWWNEEVPLGSTRVLQLRFRVNSAFAIAAIGAVGTRAGEYGFATYPCRTGDGVCLDDFSLPSDAAHVVSDNAYRIDLATWYEAQVIVKRTRPTAFDGSLRIRPVGSTDWQQLGNRADAKPLAETPPNRADFIAGAFFLSRDAGHDLDIDDLVVKTAP